MRIIKLIGVVIASLSLALPASVSNANATYNDVDKLVQKGFAGVLSQTEIDYLIKEYPDIAQLIPDNSSKPVLTVMEKVEGSPKAGSGCKTTTGTVSRNNLSGQPIYTFSSSVYWCWDLGAVIQINNPTGHLAQIASGATYNGEISNYTSATGGSTGSATIMWQVTIGASYFGSLTVSHPRIDFSLYGNGVASVSTQNM